jgi:hypothetical protein
MRKKYEVNEPEMVYDLIPMCDLGSSDKVSDNRIAKEIMEYSLPGYYAPPGSPAAIRETDTSYPIHDLYKTVPGFKKFKYWLVWSTKNTNYFFFKYEPTTQRLVTKLYTMIQGQKIDVFIYDEPYKRNVDAKINDELTNCVDEWMEHMGGLDKSFKGYVIPRLLIDNIISGNSCFFKFFVPEDDPIPEFRGQLQVKHMDPRSYVLVFHDYKAWEKLTQMPLVQSGTANIASNDVSNIGHQNFQEDSADETVAGQPTTYHDFVNNYNPAIRHMWGNLSSPGNLIHDKIRDLEVNEYYRFDLYPEIPMTSAITIIKEKFENLFNMSEANKRYSFPFIIVKVPRLMFTKDRDPSHFKGKLKSIGKNVKRMKHGDSFIIQGPSWDRGEKIGDGTEFEPVPLANHTKDFTADLRYYDEQIAYALNMSIENVLGAGTKGDAARTSSMNSIESSNITFIENLRERISSVGKRMISDYIWNRFRKKVEPAQIKIQWTSLRDTDPAVTGVLIRQFTEGENPIMTRKEARQKVNTIPGWDIATSDMIDENVVELKENVLDPSRLYKREVSSGRKASQVYQKKTIDSLITEFYKFDDTDEEMTRKSADEYLESLRIGNYVSSIKMLNDNTVHDAFKFLMRAVVNEMKGLFAGIYESESNLTDKLRKDVTSAYRLKSSYLRDAGFNPDMFDGVSDDISDSMLLVLFLARLKTNRNLMMNNIISDIVKSTIKFLDNEHGSSLAYKIIMIDRYVDVESTYNENSDPKRYLESFEIDRKDVRKLVTGEYTGICFILNNNRNKRTHGSIMMKFVNASEIIKYLSTCCEAGKKPWVSFYFIDGKISVKIRSSEMFINQKDLCYEIPGFLFDEIVSIVPYMLRAVSANKLNIVEEDDDE